MNTLFDVVIKEEWTGKRVVYHWEIYRPGAEQRGAMPVYDADAYWMWSAKLWIKIWYWDEMRAERKIEKRIAKKEAYGDLKVYRFRLGK